jgi:hypothetical protein
MAHISLRELVGLRDGVRQSTALRRLPRKATP